MAADKIIVALDCGKDRAIELADMLQGHATWLKVGMTLFYGEGPAVVREFKQRGFKVFIDLKLHDIPHQVRGAAKAVTAIGADMFTVHASGGQAMMQAAVEGAREAIDEAQAAGTGLAMPSILAVTVLTSMDDATLASVGVPDKAAQQVERLGKLAARSGVAGVVASPLEAAMLRRVLGDKLIVTPGVRPAGSDAGDQSRVTTPRQAFANGSTHVVIGRPITQAPDPRAAFGDIVSQLAG